MARKNSLISLSITETGVMVFEVGDAGSFSFNPTTSSEEIRNRAMLHGFAQKISDGAAFPKEANATPSDKLSAMEAIALRLADGEWKAKRGDGTAVQTGIVLRAFLEWVETSAKAKKAPFDPEASKAKFAEIGGWATAKKIAPVAEIIERMKAESGTASEVDADALLAALGL